MRQKQKSVGLDSQQLRWNDKWAPKSGSGQRAWCRMLAEVQFALAALATRLARHQMPYQIAGGGHRA